MSVIRDNDWMKQYDPVLDGTGDSIIQFDTKAEVIEFIFKEVLKVKMKKSIGKLCNSKQWELYLPYRYAWTLVENDHGNPITVNGLAYVNRLTHYACRNPWGTDTGVKNDDIDIEVKDE